MKRDLQTCHKEVFKPRRRNLSKITSGFDEYLRETSAVTVALCSLDEPRVQRESHDRL